MTEERRHQIIRELRDLINKEEGNVLTLYCLIATMTDEKLEEFHKNILDERG